MTFQKIVTVISNEEKAPGHYKLVMDAPDIASEFVPGQFIQVKVPKSEEFILRRPFSIAGREGNNIVIFYKVAGEGTKRMTLLKSGEKADIIGPLGNSFNIDNLYEYVILIGGGIGCAPIIALSEHIKGKTDFSFFMGLKSKDNYAYADVLGDLEEKVFIATEDGSLGVKGFVTAGFFEFWEKAALAKKKGIIYACGPRPLLKAVNDFLDKESADTRFQIAFEEKMACGVGACRGCVIPTVDGYKSVCKEGPVFDGRKILWDKLDSAV